MPSVTTRACHATYSWYLYNGQGYTHDPMMHGPFKFFSVAFIWKGLAFLSAAPFLSNWAHWGPSDYTVRILPAIFGTALVALPYFFRGYLGRAGALFAALFLAFSPVLLFFSRYIRDDVLIAFFTLALVICIWRYLSERRTLYLFLIAGLLALSFTTMEATFLIAATLPALPRSARCLGVLESASGALGGARRPCPTNRRGCKADAQSRKGSAATPCRPRDHLRPMGARLSSASCPSPGSSLSPGR